MPVTWHDLEFALLASDSSRDAQSWIHEQTGKYLALYDGEGGGPPPAGETGWHQLPDAMELDLKQRLVDDFVIDECPTLRDEVRRCFSRRGAWRAFKDLLSRRQMLNQWNRYEDAATRRALLAWAAERGIEVVDGPVGGGPLKSP